MFCRDELRFGQFSRGMRGSGDFDCFYAGLGKLQMQALIELFLFKK